MNEYLAGVQDMILPRLLAVSFLIVEHRRTTGNVRGHCAPGHAVEKQAH
jgi:hypothetical protein